MKIQAAVAREAGADLRLETLELEQPRDSELLVRVVATGVCHTDLVVRDQILPTPLPVVLGHEGAGVVERVGRLVQHAAPGDHVLMSFNSCGRCPSCTEHESAYCHEFFPRNFFATREDGSSGLSVQGQVVHGNFFGQSSFATHALCHDRNVVVVPKDLPLEKLGPLACGVQTGAGAIINALKVKPGKSVAIFGTGSVGLSALMAARAIGAAPIIAVDTNANRRSLALKLGAEYALDPQDGSVTERIIELTRAGVDYALDTTGHPAVIASAVAALAPRGSCGVLGASAAGTQISLDEEHFMGGGRRLLGIVEGSSEPRQFIPLLIDMYRRGLLPFDQMLQFYDLQQINAAMHDSESGRTVKPVLRISDS